MKALSFMPIDAESFIERFNQAVAFYDIDDSAYSELAYELRAMDSPETLEQLLELTNSEIATFRVVAIEVLGGLGYPERFPFVEERLERLSEIALTSPTEDELSSVLWSLTMLDDQRTFSLALQFIGHPNKEIRRAVVDSLVSFTEDTAPEQVVDGLITLMSDSEDIVRDEATFQLGTQWKNDDPKVRAALRSRLDDPDFTTFSEAVAGLVRRGEPGLTKSMIQVLDGTSVKSWYVDAIYGAPDPAYLPYLEALKSNGFYSRSQDYPHIDDSTLNSAIDACIAASNPAST
jgi:HEAT repeat protein